MNNILVFKSFSPFLPEIEIPVYISTLEEKYLEKLLQFCLNKIPSIFKETDENLIPPGKTSPPPAHWLTNRGWQYNILDNQDESIVYLKQHILKSYHEYCEDNDVTPEKIYAHGWLNECPTGTKIHPHNHEHVLDGNNPLELSYLSGNVCIRTKNTVTNFKSPFVNMWAPINNESGKVYIFPSYVTHSTSENNEEETRITLAFDLITEYIYNLNSDHYNGTFCELK